MSDAMSRRGTLRRPVPPSSDRGRGREGVAYMGRGCGFSGVGAGAMFTRSGIASGRGVEEGLGGLRLCGGCCALAERVRVRSARRDWRKVITEA